MPISMSSNVRLGSRGSLTPEIKREPEEQRCQPDARSQQSCQPQQCQASQCEPPNGEDYAQDNDCYADTGQPDDSLRTHTMSAACPLARRAAGARQPAAAATHPSAQPGTHAKQSNAGPGWKCRAWLQVDGKCPQGRLIPATPHFYSDPGDRRPPHDEQDASGRPVRRSSPALVLATSYNRHVRLDC